MATQTSPAHPPPAQVVGNAFVEQYYLILHQSPELVHRFYTDSSVLSRPGPDGIMASVKSMQAINEAILSLDYKDFKAEIKTIDAQDSYKDGVVVLVTGWLIVKDNVKRKFTQSFFLAPQDKGYFVLNDMFRYLDEDNSPPSETPAVSVNGTAENTPAVPSAVPSAIPSAPVTPDPEPSHIPDQPVPENATPAVELAYGNGEVVHEASDNGEVSAVEAQVVETQVPSGQTEAHPVVETASTVQEDTPKKSYASIVKVNKGTKVASPVYVPTRKVAPSSAGKVAAGSAAKVEAGHAEQHTAPAPATESSAPSSNNGTNGTHIPEEDEGHSIYIRSLPIDASVEEVEEVFKKFGQIKPNGVQVRSNKQGFCFGFVEFVSLESKQSALEASSISIGRNKAFVEEKRTSTRVGPTGRPRFPPGRTGFRNDNFRGRSNFGGGGGGRGYGRSEFGNRSEYSGRRGSSGGRSGDGYQRVENGRGGRQAGMSQTAAVSA